LTGIRYASMESVPTTLTTQMPTTLTTQMPTTLTTQMPTTLTTQMPTTPTQPICTECPKLSRKISTRSPVFTGVRRILNFDTA
jgi:hypothetical protein